MSDDSPGEPWRNALDELDIETLAAQAMAMGAFWPIAAIALAAIDKGSIDKGSLLAIIESLEALCRIETEGALADPDDSLLLLGRLREFLDGVPWSAGRVLDRLQHHEGVQFVQMMLRLERRKRS